MTQTFNFTTNIEKRMPTTGEVFFVDRMTSDYAEQHPFDVDGYLEQVYQKWQDCETIGFRETREALRRQWDATLGCRNPRGNAALYPNKNGEKHPALMEAWLKAGDYWRRGLRLGDVLPAVVPPCKITRTEDGWIALFPKDLHLLENCRDEVSEPADTCRNLTAPAVTDEPSPAEEPEYSEAEKSVAISESITNQRAEMRRQKRKRREEEYRREQERLAEQRASEEQAKQRRKVFAAVGAVAVTLVAIHFFGLLGPAFFGLVAGGLLKG